MQECADAALNARENHVSDCAPASMGSADELARIHASALAEWGTAVSSLCRLVEGSQFPHVTAAGTMHQDLLHAAVFFLPCSISCLACSGSFSQL